MTAHLCDVLGKLQPSRVSFFLLLRSMICQACNESHSQHLYATKVCKLNLRAAATYHNKQCLQDDADKQSALVCRLLAYVEGFLCVHSPPSKDQLLGFGPANQPRQQLCASSPAVQESVSGIEACPVRHTWQPGSLCQHNAERPIRKVTVW